MYLSLSAIKIFGGSRWLINHKLYIKLHSINSCAHLSSCREQPIFTTRAHVFQIDPNTKKNWVPASKQAVTVSYFYDVVRNSYRIISVDGAKVPPTSWFQCSQSLRLYLKQDDGFEKWREKDAPKSCHLHTDVIVIMSYKHRAWLVFIFPFKITANEEKRFPCYPIVYITSISMPV